MASKRFRESVGIDPERVISAAVDAALGETQKPKKKKHHPGRVLVAGAAVAAAAAVGEKRMPKLVKVPLRMGMHKLGGKARDMSHVDDLADAVRDRLSRRDEPNVEYYDDDEDLDDDEYADEEEFDDEPLDEAEEDEADDEDDFDDEDEEDDEGFDDEPEDDEGPSGEGDEIEDDEPEDDEPEEEVEGEEIEDDEPEDDEPEEEEESEDDEPEEEEPEEDDEKIAARSLELGIRSDSNGRRVRDRAPDLFETLRTPHRRPAVMRRLSQRVDPAIRPPKPDERRSSDKRRGRSSKPKSKAARA